MKIQVKRIYSAFSETDGIRVLVDKLWPRGITKTDAKLDDWWGDIAPSTELRKWFNHQPANWEDFSRAYLEELSSNRVEIKNKIIAIDTFKPLTLLFAAKDEDHNHALVLKHFIESNMSWD